MTTEDLFSSSPSTDNPVVERFFNLFIYLLLNCCSLLVLIVLAIDGGIDGGAADRKQHSFLHSAVQHLSSRERMLPAQVIWLSSVAIISVQYFSS